MSAEPNQEQDGMVPPFDPLVRGGDFYSMFDTGPALTDSGSPWDMDVILPQTDVTAAPETAPTIPNFYDPSTLSRQGFTFSSVKGPDRAPAGPSFLNPLNASMAVGAGPSPAQAPPSLGFGFGLLPSKVPPAPASTGCQEVGRRYQYSAEAVNLGDYYYGIVQRKWREEMAYMDPATAAQVDMALCHMAVNLAAKVLGDRYYSVQGLMARVYNRDIVAGYGLSLELAFLDSLEWRMTPIEE